MSKLPHILAAYTAVAAAAALLVAALALAGVGHIAANQAKPLPRGCVQGFVPAQVNGKPVLLPATVCANTKEA